MADNRISLVCNICHPPGSDIPAAEHCWLGKYFTSSGWRKIDEPDMVGRLNEFFARHEHLGDEGASIRGSNWFRLEYEDNP